MATIAARTSAWLRPSGFGADQELEDATPSEGHGSMNQARDVHVSGYGQVHIGNNYGTTAQAELHQRQNKTLKNLSSVPYEDRKNVNPTRVAGTCKWFLAHPLYKQWRKGTNPMLWVSAEPGCGKSVLSRFLIDEELPTEYGTETPNDNIICYFFFKDGVQDQRTLQDALRCILKQLFSQKRTLLSHSVLDRFETESHLSASLLWRLLLQTANKPEAGNIVVLLDTLDECEQDSRHELYKLLETCPNIRLGGESSQLRLFLTSRPSANLVNGLGYLPVIHLEGETAEEVDKIAEEIKMVIESEIERIGHRFAISSKQKKGLHSRLLSVENRTYLWAHLTLDLIWKDLLAGRRNILTHSSELPQSVEAAYDSMLSQSHSPSLAKRLLQIVLAATRPLSLAETAAVLAWSDGDQRDVLETTLTEQEYERRVRGLCGLFTIVGGKVSLLHQTIREFLLASTQTSNTAQHQPPLMWRHSITMQQSHHLLAQACIQLLLSNESNFPGLSKPGPWLDRKASLWSYASLNWNLHARYSDFKDVAAMQKLCQGPSQSLETEWFRHFLHYNARDKQLPMDSSFTPIQIAAFCGNSTLVHHLLRVNDLEQVLTPIPSPWSREVVGISAVSLAAEQGHSQIVKEILGYFPLRLRHLLRYNPLTFRDLEQRTPLGTAALHGHAQTVLILLQEGAYMYEQDQYGSIPLINAFCSGEQEVVEILIEHDEITDMTGIERQLHLQLIQAINAGKRRAVQGIATSGRLNLNMTLYKDQLQSHSHGPRLITFSEFDYEPSGFLALACHSGETDIVRILLESGSDVNHVDDLGMTPLHWAAIANSNDTIGLLREWGCSINATNVSGQTPLALCRSLDTILALLNCGAHIPSLEHWTHEEKEMVLSALEDERLPEEMVPWLEDSAEEIIVFDLVMVLLVFSDQDHLLHDTISNSAALSDPTCFSGWFLIHFAAAFGYGTTGCLKKLLAMGADIICINYAGESPLDVAIAFGNIHSIIKILSHRGFGPCTERDLISLRRLPDETLIEIQECAYNCLKSE